MHAGWFRRTAVQGLGLALTASGRCQTERRVSKSPWLWDRTGAGVALIGGLERKRGVIETVRGCTIALTAAQMAAGCLSAFKTGSPILS